MFKSYKEWRNFHEAFQTYFLVGLSLRPINEDASTEVCVTTPISGYAREIETIKDFAQANADQMAQVLMFSPLTANVSFSSHWDNFPIVMNILKTFFPDKISKENVMKTPLKDIPLDIKGTGEHSEKTIFDKWPDDPAEILSAIFHSLNVEDAKVLETIAGWKFDTIVSVWNNRHELYEKLMAAKNDDDDERLLNILAMIPGAGAVKAGFMAQLIFGRIGCIDTHNVDIYRRVFTDMAPEIEPELWKVKKNLTKKDMEKGLKFPSANVEPIKRYMSTIKKLAQRSIGSQQLWDVWVDFVANFYKTIASPSKPGGPYTPTGPALDPNAPEYEKMRGILVPKEYRKKIGEFPVVTGTPEGGGASLTHILAAKKPEEMLAQLRKHIGTPVEERPDKEKPEDWARAVNLRGSLPRAVRYGLTTAISPDNDINKEKLQDVIAHHVRRASGVPVDPKIQKEIDAIEKLPEPRAIRGKNDPVQESKRISFNSYCKNKSRIYKESRIRKSH